MHRNLLLACGVFWVLSLTACNGQSVSLQPDYTGATSYLAPKGWTIQTQEQNGVYFWMTHKNPNDAQSPSIVVMAMPDAPGEPRTLIRQVLGPLFQSLTETDSRLLSSGEAHLLLDGQSAAGPAKVAATFVRDAPNGLMFVSCFAATPQDYQSLGKEDLLFRCLNRPNPFGASSTTPANSPSEAHTPQAGKNIVQDPVAEQFGAGVNMQDKGVQQQILQSSAAFTGADLQGEWTQVMSAMTGNVYEEVGSGKLIYGSTGYGHILKLKSNGQYELTYSYRNGPENAADVVEKGTYTLKGKTLTLNAASYSGSFLVYGQSHPQSATRPGTRQFQVGMHPSGKYLTLKGKPFEYTISTDMDAYGNPVFQEGFYRTR